MILGRCRRRMRTGTIRRIRGSSLRQGGNVSRTRALRQRLLPAKNGHAGTAPQGVIRAYESDSSSKSPASSVAFVSQGQPLANQASSIAWNARRGGLLATPALARGEEPSACLLGTPQMGRPLAGHYQCSPPRGLRSCRGYAPAPPGCCRVANPPILPGKEETATNPFGKA
jgi:hypothetical protein